MPLTQDLNFAQGTITNKLVSKNFIRANIAAENIFQWGNGKRVLVSNDSAL